MGNDALKSLTEKIYKCIYLVSEFLKLTENKVMVEQNITKEKDVNEMIDIVRRYGPMVVEDVVPADCDMY